MPMYWLLPVAAALAEPPLRSALLDDLCGGLGLANGSAPGHPVGGTPSFLQIDAASSPSRAVLQPPSPRRRCGGSDYMVWTLHANISGAPAPRPRRGVVGVFVPAHARTLLFGGCTSFSAHGGCSSELHAHSVEHNTWAVLERSPSSVRPTPRGGGTAALVGDSAIFFGGNAAGASMNDLHVLDAASLAWGRPSIAGAKPAAARARGGRARR